MKNVFVTTVQNVILRLVAVYVLLAGKDHLVKKVSWQTKVSKGAKIRNRYNEVPHLTQDTNGKITNSQ